jgi:hypothetical protein
MTRLDEVPQDGIERGRAIVRDAMTVVVCID